MSVHLPTALPGCVLRPWRDADRADLVRHANDRRVWRNMTHTFPHPVYRADARLWLAIAADPGDSIQLAIEVDGRAAGGIGAIAGEGIFSATAQFGYWLGEPFWGRGIASAAARALADRIAREQLFARLEAQVFAMEPGLDARAGESRLQREAAAPLRGDKDGQLIATVLYARVLALTSG